jgi:hypothetical protein
MSAANLAEISIVLRGLKKIGPEIDEPRSPQRK